VDQWRTERDGQGAATMTNNTDTQRARLGRTTRAEAEQLAVTYPTDYPDDGPVALMAEDYIALQGELEGLQAQLTTTLTPCPRCGGGYRARDMATVGGERLCAPCAGDELEAARGLMRDALPHIS